LPDRLLVPLEEGVGDEGVEDAHAFGDRSLAPDIHRVP
jgi:hypothetical protein